MKGSEFSSTFSHPEVLMAQEEFRDDPMSDIIEQWRCYFSVLALQPGDLIFDVGCNTGDAEHLPA